MAVTPATAQTTTTSTVTISPVNVPPINVPKLNVQVPTARTAPSASGPVTKAWAVSAPSEPESDAEDPDNPQSDAFQPLVSRSIGSQNGSYPRATGILQLVAATEPGEPTPGTPFPTPPPERLMQPNGPPGMQWNNPYETGPAEEKAVTGWYRIVPMGMLPWGPRTPLSKRSVGWGQPLLPTSWLNRPWSAGLFTGVITGTPLLHGVNQQPSFYGGYRAGFDYDFYWGVEAQLGASSICLSEPDRTGGQPGTNDYWNLDLNLHYYPWGDSAWRPYASFGMGMANFSFWDQYNNHYDQVEFATPIGVGLKYRWTNWVAFRADLTDNIAYGRGALESTSNFSATAGIEMRFGGVRRSYWPWNPGRVIR